ncbi:MAG: DUF2294 domain-containing protein [Leptolyngbyaceae cyanobacterium]
MVYGDERYKPQVLQIWRIAKHLIFCHPIIIRLLKIFFRRKKFLSTHFQKYSPQPAISSENPPKRWVWQAPSSEVEMLHFLRISKIQLSSWQGNLVHITSSSDKRAFSTVGELERLLSQNIQALCRRCLGQQPTNVLCHLFGQELVIILENSRTLVEQCLSDKGASDLSLEVRQILNQHLKQEINALVESILQVSVRGLLIDTCTGLERTGIIVALSDTPLVRNPNRIPKTPAYKQARRKEMSRTATKGCYQPAKPN